MLGTFMCVTESETAIIMVAAYNVVNWEAKCD